MCSGKTQPFKKPEEILEENWIKLMENILSTTYNTSIVYQSSQSLKEHPLSIFSCHAVFSHWVTRATILISACILVNHRTLNQLLVHKWSHAYFYERAFPISAVQLWYVLKEKKKSATLNNHFHSFLLAFRTSATSINNNNNHFHRRKPRS